MLTRRQSFLLLAPFIFVVIPFLICPAGFGFLASFTNYAPFSSDVRFVGLDNYRRVLQDDIFRTSIHNILVFTIITVFAEMVIGVGVAYALRRSFRGRGLLRVVLLIPWLVSPVASGVMWHQLMDERTGLLNFLPALLGLPRGQSPLGSNLAFLAVMATEIWRKWPLVTFLVLPGLLAISAEHWDHARLDGLSLLGQIRHVVVPQLRLLFLTIILLLGGDAFGVSESIFFLTGGGPGSQTMTPGIYSYNKAILAENWSRGMTTGWLIAAGVALLGLGYLRLSRTEMKNR